MTRNTDWFAKCGWGVFCHYLGSSKTTSEEWNAEVDGFDVEDLAAQLQSVGASYFFTTTGQGSGHYCAPNDTYDRLTGIRPSKCSRRDLVSDLYDALHPLGIELLVYAGAEPRFPDQLVAAYTSYIIGKEGVITWDVPITRGGLIPDAFVKQLKSIGNTVKKG